jgi:hypothetical protein
LRVSLRTLIAVSATALSVCLSGVIAGTAQATASVPRTATQPGATSYNVTGKLAGVATASNSSAWAVGSAGPASAPKVLLLHWNGKAWSRVTSPSVLTASGELAAITVLNAKSAWAVGTIGGLGTGKNHSLLLHWNGKAWSQVTSPAPVTGGDLAGIAVTVKTGWAVGYVNTNPSAPACCAGTPLIFRWNGVKWSRLTSKLGNGIGLSDVAITGSTAWAIGSPVSMITGALAKWNGSAWSWAANPLAGNFRPLNGIAAGPGGTAFIVGTNNDVPGPPISERWNGKAWQKVTVSGPGRSGLNAVAYAPGGIAWAAGSYFLGSERTLIMRWTGKAWTRVTSPGTNAELDGLAFSASGYGWAVGGANSPLGSTSTLILHWNGKSWG